MEESNNRVIKFRGEFLNTKTWITSTSLVHDEDGTFLLSGLFCVEINPNTIGQFTGLTDKNNKEIYEGDIVEWKGRKYEVIFQSGMFYASIESSNKNIAGGYPLWVLTEENNCLIVGNIHDKSTNE